MTQHRYHSPLVDVGTAEEPKFIPLAMTALPGNTSHTTAWTPGEDGTCICIVSVDDADHARILALDGVTEDEA